MAEVHGISKIIRKKLKDKMHAQEPKIYEAGRKAGLPDDVIKTIWETTKKSADYQFCKCIWEEETVEHKIKGKIKLKDVQIGDYILAFNVKTKLDHYVKVTNIYHKDSYCFSTTLNGDGGTIHTSEDHKFLMANSSDDKSLKAWKMATLKQINNSINGKYIDKYDWLTYIMTKRGARYVGSSFPTYDWSVKPKIQRKLPTIDLEVDHSDHNFYCNDIVVSNSHSYSYCYLTATTAYFKANHPKEFFLSLLINAANEGDPLSEINKIEKELKYFGIRLPALIGKLKIGLLN